MLLLLKPWRNVATDLKSPEQTWQSAFEKFHLTASQSIQHIVSGIQYFYQYKTSAQNAQDSATELVSSQVKSAVQTVNGEFDLEEDAPHNLVMALTEEGLQSLIASQLPMREEIHAHIAVETAKSAKIFSDHSSKWTLVNGDGNITNASEEEIQKLASWKAQMESDVNQQNTTPGSDGPQSANALSNTRSVSCLTDSAAAPIVSSINDEAPEAALPPVDPSMLKADQCRAYDIVTWHLDVKKIE